jgi:hypothetical protein
MDRLAAVPRLQRLLEIVSTVDASHFEHIYGKRIEGLLVLRPAAYFDRRGRA